MAFQVSPGVNTSEIDLTNVVVGAGTSTGGFAGRFRWGPIEDIQLITDEDNLVDTFQKPDDNNFEHFFTAANFLSYSNALNVVRAANTTVANAAAPKNACANTGTYVNVQITTSESYYNTYDDEQGGTAYSTAANGPFVAKWAGDLGNTFKYSMCPADRPSATLTGTVAWAVSTGVLTGTATLFGIELRVGDAISIAGETGLHIVSVVTSNVAVTCTSTSSSDSADVSSGAAAVLQKRSAFHTIASNLKGTVAVTADSTTVTGTGTLFSSQFIVGDKITINGETRKVKTLTSNTVIVTDTKFLTAASAQTYTRDWEYAGAFPEGPPTTSTHAADKLMALDEIHIAVVDEDGEWTGNAGEVVESHANLSVAKGARDNQGEDIYYKNWINAKSKFMWWLQRPIIDSEVTSGDYTTPAATGSKTLRAWGATADASGTQQADEFYMPGKPQTLSFTSGTAGTAPSDADVIRAYDLMKSAEDADVSLLMTGSHGSTVARHCIGQIAESRKDCIAFFSPEKSDVVGTASSSASTTAVTGYRDTVNQNSSYAVMDSGWKQMFDKHNDKMRYVPLNGDIAGLCARTDYTHDAWWSPAGFNRGQIFGVTKLAFNPTKADRDKLYKSRVNPVVTFAGQGTLLFGDKTLLSNDGSAFSRINVRRLFIVLEKAIANAAKFQLFEFNDSFTRANFRAMIEPFLRQVQGRRGIYDFQVICDETNNTGNVIDSNQFVAAIFIKPARSINFITLTFVASRTGVDFEEVYGAAGIST